MLMTENVENTEKRKRKIECFHPPMTSVNIVIFPSAFLVINNCCLFYVVIIGHIYKFISCFLHIQL